MCTFLNTYEYLLYVYLKTTYILYTHTKKARETESTCTIPAIIMLYFLTYCLITEEISKNRHYNFYLHFRAEKPEPLLGEVTYLKAFGQSPMQPDLKLT